MTCRIKCKKSEQSTRTKKGQCRNFWEEWKKQNACVFCGESDPILVQADHYKGVKIRELSANKFWACNGGVEAMKEEEKKVRCLCRYCHQLHTRQWLWDKKKSKTHPVVSVKRKVALEEKLKRSKCLLCYRKVSPENANCFIFDHGLNFDKKLKSVSAIVHRKKKLDDTSIEILQREMNWCRLLCANCDQRETRKELWDHAFPTPFEEEKKIFWNF